MATSIGHQRSKSPATALAGSYGHPTHPMFVTIPIGAWTSALVFDVVSRAVDDGAGYARGANLLLGIGLVGAVLAIGTGFLDYSRLPAKTRVNQTATLHLSLNLGATALVLLSLLLRITDGTSAEGTPVGPLVVLAVTLVALAVSGWLGGKLAYHYGVRVADEATQAEGFAEHGALPPGARDLARDDSPRYRTDL
jgi:uncharacterized membrane protein